MDPLDLLFTTNAANPDFNESDAAQDLEQSIDRNTAIAQFTDGLLSGDDLLQLVEVSGTSPDAYFDMAVTNLYQAMGRVWHERPSGLLLPH